MRRILAKYALIPIGTGIGAIAFVIYFEHKYLPEPPAHPSIVYSILPYSLKFGDHLAIAFLSIGVVTLLLEFTHLQKYFYGLFAEALTDDRYVQQRSTDKAWVKKIQTMLMTGVFGDSINREGTFFHDYYDQLQNFVGAPYRDQYTGTTAVEDSTTHENAFDIVEVVSFLCCKMGDYITPTIGWTAHQDELIDMTFFQITLKVPDISEPIKITPDHESLKPHPDWGHMESLEAYKDKDGLAVTLELHYVVKKDRAFATNMGLITKALTWTITFPQDLTIQLDRFVLDDSVAHDTSTLGKCTYAYPYWLLPGDGFAFHFRKR